MHKAVRLLRVSELSEAYEDAFTAWDDDEAALWETAAADGLER